MPKPEFLISEKEKTPAFIPDYAAVVFGLLLFFFLAGLGIPCAEAQSSGLPGALPDNFNLYLIDAPDGLQSLKVTFKDKDITEDKENVYREISVSAPVANFPVSGLSTAKINLYTGGANCCQGYYLLVSGGTESEDYAAYVEPYDGGLAQNSEPKGYAAIDPAFKGYEKGNLVSLSMAESPRLSRLLIFEGGMWRADKIGEFPAYYQSMIDETIAMEDMTSTSTGISLGYYTLMKGDGSEAAEEAFKSAMPENLRDDAALLKLILEDIEIAAEKFNPVRNLKIKEVHT